MAVTMMSSNYAFLEKLGIPAELIAKIKQSGLNVALGFTEFKLLNKQGATVASYTFPQGVKTTDVMKGTVDGKMLDFIKSGIMNVLVAPVVVGEAESVPLAQLFKAKELEVTVEGLSEAEIEKLFPGTKVKISGLPEKKSVFKPLSEAIEQDSQLAGQIMSKPQKAGVPAKLSATEVLKMEAVPLAQATMLYQPVRGTDKSSRYFVVAMNDDIRVAARIKGASVSMRVEGNITQAVRQALVNDNMKFDDKGKYLSRHLSADKATPEKIVGATLMGSGIAFDTPLPSMEVIKNAK